MDCLLPEHVKCFRECFDHLEAYSASLFSDLNFVASAHDIYEQIDEFVRAAMRNRNPLVFVELCIVMETHIKACSLKHNLSGYLAIALRAYIALLKVAKISATEERAEWKAYVEESREQGYNNAPRRKSKRNKSSQQKRFLSLLKNIFNRMRAD